MLAPAEMERYLESQANQIEWVLHSHRVPARVLGGTVTPRWIHYQILPEFATKIARITALSEEIALHLGASSVRIARQGASVQIEVPRLNPQKVGLMDLFAKLGDMPRQSTVLGMDNSGSPLILRLASPEVAHVLIA